MNIFVRDSDSRFFTFNFRHSPPMSSPSSAKRSESHGAANNADVRPVKRARLSVEPSNKMELTSQEKSTSSDGFPDEIDGNIDDDLPTVEGPSDLYLDTVS